MLSVNILEGLEVGERAKYDVEIQNVVAVAALGSSPSGRSS